MENLDFEKELKKMERDGVISRAQFLQLMAVAGAFLALGTDKAYAAMAARLKRTLKNPDITLIDPSDRQFYQPGFTLIASGVYGADDVWKPQADCMPEGVKWVKDYVKIIHPDANSLETASNGRIDYDFLVLAPGAQVNWDKVEGITKDTLGQGNAHSIYDHVGAQRTWPAMKEFAEKGGRGIFCDTYTKHKCGGAPKKVCLLTWDNARKNGKTADIDLHYYTAEKQLYDVPYFTKRLEQYSRRRERPPEGYRHLGQARLFRARGDRGRREDRDALYRGLRLHALHGAPVGSRLRA